MLKSGLFPVIAAALAIALAVPDPAAAAKADAAFTVANYPVQATDKNAVSAKEKAIADGQDAAFRSLLKRIVPVTAYRQLGNVKDLKAANLVSGVSVRSEQNSSTDYIANLDFSFQAEALRSALAAHGIPFVEAQAPFIIVVPVVRKGNPAEGKPEARAAAGPWLKAWQGLDLEHTLTPVKIDDLKSTIHNDTVDMLLNGTGTGERILAGEYKSETVVLAVAEMDTVQKKLNITLAGTDAVGLINLKRSYRVPDGDEAFASDFAAVVSLGILEGRWKATKATAIATPPPPAAGQPQWGRAAAAEGDPVHFIAEFSSPAQWNEIRTQLLDTPGVEDLEIASVSAQNADINLKFPGGPGALANSLGHRGLSMMVAETGWILRSTH